MKCALALALLAVAVWHRAAEAQPESAPVPPVPPPYQMRGALPAGDRLGGHGDGASLYSNRCGACHLAGGMGTNLLTKQRIAVGEPAASGLLVNRRDLTQTYVRVVVRSGMLAMPPLTRVDVTDAELDAIARYLGSAGQ